MKYTKEERLDIGKRIYDSEITRYEAAEQYGISEFTARDYMRLYRDTNQLPKKRSGNRDYRKILSATSKFQVQGIEEFQNMTKEELIKALVMAHINEARFKKGYEVKGDGSVIVYTNKNIK